MGGNIKQGVDSAISIITGLVSGNIAGGLAGELIKEQTTTYYQRTQPRWHKNNTLTNIYKRRRIE